MRYDKDNLTKKTQMYFRWLNCYLRHDTHHNDTQHNDIQHKGRICDTQHK